MDTCLATTAPTQADEIQGVEVAAIVEAEGGVVDGLLTDFAIGLRNRGREVRGLVQQVRGRDVAGSDRLLVDLESGTSYPLSQNLGSGSVSCCIDTQGLAAASIVLRRALCGPTDLAIANRFGALEAAGAGFAAEMLALLSAQIPLLTVVADRHLADWRRFTGDLAIALPPRLGALEAWFAAVERRRIQQ